MILRHSCKVRSIKAQLVTKEYYDHFYDIVSCHEFFYAMSQAKQQLQGTMPGLETRCFQEEFTLPMKRNIFGLLTIPIQINGKKLTFIIDTGAQISGIKEYVGKKLQLKETQGSVTIGSIGGKQKSMKGVMADVLTLGALEYRSFPLIALHDSDFSLRFGSIDLFAFDGIIGWDILSQLDFELDDIKKQFKVLKNRFKVPYPNMIKGSFPVFIVTLEGGGHALYGFDSGSKMSWIGEDTIATHKLHIAAETTSMGFGVHGLEKLAMKVIDQCSISLDKAHIDLRNTMSGRCNLFPSFVFDGILGNEICKGRRMRIINSANMVLIA